MSKMSINTDCLLFDHRRTWGPKPKYDRVSSYDIKSPYDLISISGPCSVESVEQINEIAKLVKEYGATHLRGGVYRAGTYPGQSFGLVDIDLVRSFHEASIHNEIPNIIELLDVRLIDRLYPYADCFQVGCRQMQNYSLLRELGNTDKPVFLKRHPGSTLDEFLGAAEHLLINGTCKPILIERGSSTHANHVRWDLSISMIPAIKKITKIPVICDASHGTGRRDLVEPMALAGIAAGADGVLIEVHTNPYKSLSDADQAIFPDEFKSIMSKIVKVRSAIQ